MERPLEQDTAIDGRGAFQAAVRDALAEAAASGWREIWLCDPDFAHWPLGERGVVDSLTQWAGAHRRLTLVALHFDELARRHQRWVRWRMHWAHVVTCRGLPELQADDVPAVLLAPGVFTLVLADPLRFRGLASRDPAVGLRMRERIDAVLQRSVETFPATTLGL